PSALRSQPRRAADGSREVALTGTRRDDGSPSPMVGTRYVFRTLRRLKSRRSPPTVTDGYARPLHVRQLSGPRPDRPPGPLLAGSGASPSTPRRPRPGPHGA